MKLEWAVLEVAVKLCGLAVLLVMGRLFWHFSLIPDSLYIKWVIVLFVFALVPVASVAAWIESKSRIQAGFLWGFTYAGVLGCSALIVFNSATLTHHQQEMNRKEFRKACAELAGEYIYRVVDGVEGLYMMRWRRFVGGSGYFDKAAKGEFPEDTYGYSDEEANAPESFYIMPLRDKDYDYFETPVLPDGYEECLWCGRGYKAINKIRIDEPYKYWRFVGLDDYGGFMTIEYVDSIKSQYGFTYSVERQESKGLEKSNLIVLDVATKEVVAVRVGFFSKYVGICPLGKRDSSFNANFIRKVLIAKGTRG